MKFSLIAIGIFLAFLSCKKDEVFTVVEPLSYFPAYPGSIWYYSNGDVSKVHTEYVAHNYQANINSSEYTETKLVPYIDREYLYGYEVTQNSMAFPLKKLLSETVTEPWVIDTVGSEYVYRKTIENRDSLRIEFADAENYKDSTYFDIVVVVEFSGSLDATQWNRKEYYAKNVGLIQVEINNPDDTLPEVIQKKLVEYNINK